MRNSFLTSLKIGGAPASLIMKVLRRCGQLKRETLDCTEKRLAFVSKFVEENGFDLDTPIPPAFVDRTFGFACGITQDASTVRLPSGIQVDSNMLSHLAAFAGAARALEEADFSATVMRKVTAMKGVTYSEISEKAGLAPTFIKTVFADQHPFPISLPAENAMLLDSVLGADGDILYSYVATDQQSAYQQHGSILDELLNRRPFGRVLAGLLATRRGTMAELVERVAQKSGIPITEAQLYHWTQSVVPSESMRPVVAALGEFLGAKGELMRAWDKESPVSRLKGYWLREQDWPEALAKQVEAIIQQNTGTSEMVRLRSAPPWTCGATVRQFRELCQSFLGYLKNVRNVEPGQLSLSLFADPHAVKGHCDF